MRPVPCRRVPWLAGLLRPRGDAPRQVCSLCGGTGAPPPTRRCAACSRPSQPEPLGSSAHAEMRPWISNRKPIGRWLLRPRGDAPRGRRFQRMARRAPPPTRRCARSDNRRHLVHRGSSAHAEMRPQMSSRTIRGFRLLRPRGDAPATASSCARPEWAPPPTRRCAPSSGARPARPPGSSAHAEMRPPTESEPDKDVEAPPPTRRCAAGGRPGQCPLCGSSAQAEMRHGYFTTTGVRDRLLRPRGDAPIARSKVEPPAPAPPPTRRCALSQVGFSTQRSGSSAHAEMRHARSARLAGARRLLRPRGDAPGADELEGLEEVAPPPTRRCASTPQRARPCS